MEPPGRQSARLREKAEKIRTRPDAEEETEEAKSTQSSTSNQWQMFRSQLAPNRPLHADEPALPDALLGAGGPGLEDHVSPPQSTDLPAGSNDGLRNVLNKQLLELEEMLLESNQEKEMAKQASACFPPAGYYQSIDGTLCRLAGGQAQQPSRRAGGAAAGGVLAGGLWHSLGDMLAAQIKCGPIGLSMQGQHQLSSRCAGASGAAGLAGGAAAAAAGGASAAWPWPPIKREPDMQEAIIVSDSDDSPPPCMAGGQHQLSSRCAGASGAVGLAGGAAAAAAGGASAAWPWPPIKREPDMQESMNISYNSVPLRVGIGRQQQSSQRAGGAATGPAGGAAAGGSAACPAGGAAARGGAAGAAGGSAAGRAGPIKHEPCAQGLAENDGRPVLSPGAHTGRRACQVRADQAVPGCWWNTTTWVAETGVADESIAAFFRAVEDGVAHLHARQRKSMLVYNEAWKRYKHGKPLKATLDSKHNKIMQLQIQYLAFFLECLWALMMHPPPNSDEWCNPTRWCFFYHVAVEGACHWSPQNHIGILNIALLYMPVSTINTPDDNSLPALYREVGFMVKGQKDTKKPLSQYNTLQEVLAGLELNVTEHVDSVLVGLPWPPGWPVVWGPQQRGTDGERLVSTFSVVVLDGGLARPASLLGSGKLFSKIPYVSALRVFKDKATIVEMEVYARKNVLSLRKEDAWWSTPCSDPSAWEPPALPGPDKVYSEVFKLTGLAD
ncbi:hypothetical protein VOLCADRAFT_99407 [Volvox carteri f. nagariensis]|uniref:Uncharacterized protein n=1 Tax=Volvox carteri f. nagariensis TaxID=3068 RepID=D8UHQ5_VOLCA|nr:uncharacterized protein VOLCADRAFT_99407 [Volvox carteri f. nagariensis]EFJ40747.1 hypothetical protein VOLCADRAFT_99407 [Volvox carteri f. nagariensis]|eukprot:XP_002958213.1 hypothetical protein VOLCADRAFT_99407 [Volvox carteri f. nagariensis]